MKKGFLGKRRCLRLSSLVLSGLLCASTASAATLVTTIATDYSDGQMGVVNGSRIYDSVDPPAQEGVLKNLGGDASIFNIHQQGESKLLLKYSLDGETTYQLLNPDGLAGASNGAKGKLVSVKNPHAVAATDGYIYATGYDLGKIGVIRENAGALEEQTAVIDLKNDIKQHANYQFTESYTNNDTGETKTGNPAAAKVHGEALLIDGRNLYVAASLNPTGSPDSYDDGFLMQYEIKDDGSLSFGSYTRIGRNTDQVRLNKFNDHILLTAVGGKQNMGVGNDSHTQISIAQMGANGRLSSTVQKKVELPAAVKDTHEDMRDLKVLPNGTAYVMTYKLSTSGTGIDAHVYQTTVSNLLSDTPQDWTEVAAAQGVEGYFGKIDTEHVTKNLWLELGNTLRYYGDGASEAAPVWQGKDFSTDKNHVNINKFLMVKPDWVTGQTASVQLTLPAELGGTTRAVEENNDMTWVGSPDIEESIEQSQDFSDDTVVTIGKDKIGNATTNVIAGIYTSSDDVNVNADGYTLQLQVENTVGNPTGIYSGNGSNLTLTADRINIITKGLAGGNSLTNAIQLDDLEGVSPTMTINGDVNISMSGGLGGNGIAIQTRDRFGEFPFGVGSSAGIDINGNLKIAGTDTAKWGIPLNRENVFSRYNNAGILTHTSASMVNVSGDVDITVYGNGVSAGRGGDGGTMVTIAGGGRIQVPAGTKYSYYALAAYAGGISMNMGADGRTLGTRDVQLDGDLFASRRNGDLHVALTTDKSWLHGIVDATYSDLYLKNGAKWLNEARNQRYYQDIEDIGVGEVVGTGKDQRYIGRSNVQHFFGGESDATRGIIYQKDGMPITIGDYSGHAVAVYNHDAASPTTFKTGDIIINKAIGTENVFTLFTDADGVTAANQDVVLNALANKLTYKNYTDGKLLGKLSIGEGLTLSSINKDITFASEKGSYSASTPPASNKAEFTTQLTGDEDMDEEYVDAHVRQDDDSYRFAKDSTITYQNNSASKSGAILSRKNLKIDASGHVLTIKTGGGSARITEAAGIRLTPTKKIDIKADTLRLFVNDENSIDPLKTAYGIKGDKGTLTISGMTEIEAGGTEVSHGVHAYMDDRVTLEGLSAKVNTAAADASALYVGYTGRLSVNVKNGTVDGSAVRLDGNVVSQDTQSRIDVALADSASYVKGLAFGNGTLNMWLQNGASWNNINQGASLPQGYWGSRITSLVGGASPERAGLIFQNEANTIAIDQYSGHMRAFYEHDASNPKKIIGGALLINHAAPGSSVTVTTDNAGLNTDAGASAAEKKLVDETLGALANKLWYRAYAEEGEYNLSGKVEIAEGMTSSSARKRIEDIEFDDAGKGVYGTPSDPKQTKTEFTTGITGEASRDIEYTDAGVRQENGSYVFTRDTKITAGETEIKAGAWLTTFSAAISNSDIKTPVNIDLGGKNLTVNTKTDISTVGITAIGNGAQLNINNAGAITVNAENTGGSQTAAIYANSGGKVHIENGGSDIESKVLKVRANNVNTKTNVAVIKTMNGVPGAESNITIDGLVDVLAEGDRTTNSGANEAVSAVASTIDIGGGTIKTVGDTWAAIRAYGEFVTQNTGVVNFNVTKDAAGMATGAGTNRAVIEGDFSTNGGMGTKGRISVGLSTPESYWLGNYVDTHGYGVTQGQFGSVNLFMKNGSYWKGFASGVMNVEMSGTDTKWVGFNVEHDMKLTLKDGATWYNAITPEQKGWKNVAAISRVKNFTGSGGFIDMTGTNRFLGLGDSLDQTGVPGAAVQGKCSAIIDKGLGETGNLEIEEFSGDTTVRYRHDATAPTTVYGGTTTIKKAAAGSKITLLTDSSGLNMESIMSADKNLVNATLNALANKLYYTAYTTSERNLTGKVTIAEGLTASSASKRLENITFNETTGQGGYVYTPAVDPPASQTTAAFNASITNDLLHDTPYVDAGIRKSDGKYVFTKDTIIRTDDTDKVIGGPWTAPNAPAISNVNPTQPLNIDLKGKKLTIETRGADTVVGISAVGKGSRVHVRNAGAITIKGMNTGSLYSPTLFANGGGSIHIENGGENLEDKVLTLRSVGKKEASPAVIKTMNGLDGAESNVTIDGLVDLLADGTYPDGKGANEGVSAVASRVDIGGGSIRATGSAWAAIRAYGEFTSNNYGTVNFNVMKGADGLANGAGTNRAILEGDIVTNGGMGTKGRVSVGLSTPDSHWIGNYADTSGYGVTPGQLGTVNLFMKNSSYWKGFSNGSMKVEMSGMGTNWTGFHVGKELELKLSDGAVWHNAITPEQTDQDNKPAISRVKHFSGSGGFIDMTGMSRFLAESTSLSGHFVKTESSSAIIEKGFGETGDLAIENYSGNTKVLYRHNAASPTTVYGGKLTIAKAAAGSAITLSTDSVGLNTESTKAVDKNLVSAALNALANKLYYTAYTTGEKNLSGKAEIAEGLTTSAASKRLENISFSKESGQGSYAYTPAVDPKPDTPKPDVPKPDTPKPDTPKPDTPKPDTPKPDTPKPDTPKPDVPKPDTPKPDTPKPDVPKPDTPKPDTPKPDTPKPDTPKPDTPKPDVPKPDTPKPDTPKPDVPKPDTPKPDTPKPDVPKPDTPKPDPKIEYGDYETKLMSGVKSAMTASTMAWRAEANDLMKRMGDLRLSPQDAGVWARVYRGKATSNKDNANFRMNYSTIQVGYDKKVGDDWRVGVAGSYMSGSSSYTAGNGKNKEGNLGVYGTWTGKSGQYVDLIAKIGRLQNEYTVYNDFGHYVKGDYTMWGGSLSAEYGKRIAMTGGTFVEPQVELIYSHMQGKSYVGSTDFRGMSMYVHQKPFDSFIGRVGFGFGKETERSTCYARVSLYHEFAGDMHTDYSDGFTPKSTVQRGSDTWVGVQLGGTMKLNDRTNLYGNFEKTFGGDIQTAWRMDAGLRWNF